MKVLSIRVTLLFLGALLLSSVGVQAQVSPALSARFEQPLPPIDARQPAPTGIAKSFSSVSAASQQRSEIKLDQVVAGLKVDRDELTQLPRFVRSTAQPLSSPKAGAAAPVAVDFVLSHPSLFELSSGDFDSSNCRIDSAWSGSRGAFHGVRYQQSIDGIDVDGSELRVNLATDNAVINVAGTMIPSARSARNISAPLLSVDQAVVNAAVNIGSSSIKAPSQRSGPAGASQLVIYNADSTLAAGTRAHLIHFPLSRSQLRLAWEVLIRRAGSHNRYRVVVDAANGNVLQRVVLTKYAATQTITLSVYDDESPAPFLPGSSTTNSFQAPTVSRSSLTLFSLNSTASPNGWINDGDNETIGNNVDAHSDLDADDEPDLPRPTGSPFRVFDPSLNLAQSPSNYVNAAVVNLFYWCNFMHDKLYELGFDEVSGNYQTDNFGRGGTGGDPVLADAQDGGGFNNANFTPAPDGEAGRIQMYVFDGPTPNRDGDLDATVICHEYVHGLSERLVGAGSFITELQSAGMGEGWSDFYALCLLSKEGDDVDAVYPVGAYITYQFGGTSFDENYYFGIRRYPYTTDLTKNPLTFQDIDPTKISVPSSVPSNPILGDPTDFAEEVHNQGEVWCAALWECRALLIKAHGFDGNQIMMQLVTDGMKLGPANPTFVQARDAIIQADVINNNGENVCNLWKGFAKRGLGASAVAPSASTTTGVVEAYDIPDECSLAINGVLIDDSTGNSNGAIDDGETVSLKVLLERPSGLTNTVADIVTGLGTTETTLTLVQTNSTYPDIAAGQIRTNDTDFALAANGVECGSQLHFLLHVSSSDGEFNLPFNLRVGSSTNLLSATLDPDLGGVVIDNTGNGLWHVSNRRGSQTGHSKTNSFYYGIEDTGTYNTGHRNRGVLLLPSVSLLGQTKVLLTFNHYLARESSAPGAFDVAKVEVSVDNGSTFVTAGGPFSSTSGSFREESVDLTPYINHDVVIRFSFDTIDSQNNDTEGWYVDDIAVKSFACASAGTAPRDVVAQGVTVSGNDGIVTVYDGVTGVLQLAQPVLTNVPHSDFTSFAINAFGGSTQQVVVAGVRNTGNVDFEVRDGVSGALGGSGSLSLLNPGEFHGIAARVDTNSAGQLAVFVSTPSTPGAPVLDVFDPSTGGLVYSVPVLDVAGYSDLQVVALNRLGNGVYDIAVIGRRVLDGAVVVDVRHGSTGSQISTCVLKKKTTAPFVAYAADLDGFGFERLVVLASGQRGPTINIVEPSVGQILYSKSVLRSAGANLRSFAVRVLGGVQRQVVVMGSNPVTGSISSELYSNKGKRLGGFGLQPSIHAPFDAVGAHTSATGLDSILVVAQNANNNKPILLRPNPVAGGSSFAVTPFAASTVQDVRLFATDVDADGSEDVVLHSARESDGVVLFEVRTSSSGALFSSFDQGNDFESPRDAFGAHVGD